MPKITDSRIVYLPEDRQVVPEQSSGITASTYTTLFSAAILEGDTTKYFKFLEEIAEKDPDILHSISTRTSYVTSKEWGVEGEVESDASAVEDYLKNVKGDPMEGLISVDGLINSMLGNSYLTGLSISEIVTDGEGIVGFNHIPAHFLTFYRAMHYPKLWTQEKPTGIPINRDKMISHYLHSGDPIRGWLGHAIGWLYVLKRTTLDARLQFQRKYGKGFLLVNMPGDKDSYEEAWDTAEDLIDNYSDVDGAVFPAGVEVDYKESAAMDGQYFFDTEDNFRSSITKIILGQESTSSSQDSNRSTASVHMEVLEKRILDDAAAIESTLTRQLVERVKELLGITSEMEFKFVVSEMEATLDEDMDEEVTEDEMTESTQEETPDE